MIENTPCKNILIISDAWHPQVNGVVRTYEFIGQELENIGHNVHVISPSDFPLSIPMPGYAEIKLALFPYKKLETMVNAYAPDIIHIATEGPLGWAARKYCMKHNKKYTTSYHTHFPDYIAKRVEKIFPFLYKATYVAGREYIRIFHRPSNAVLVATKSIQDMLRSWGFTMNLPLLTRGVKLDIFTHGRPNMFLDIPHPVALYVGRVSIEKNIEDFLSMNWAGSKVIVGDGPAREMLQKKFPSAVFLGVKKGQELADCYRSADVFVFPSKTDTFGIVLIEALACGLPVAAYHVTGPQDIITDDALGILAPENGTAHDLSIAACEALRHGDSHSRGAYAHEHYTWEKAARQFVDSTDI